MLCQYHRAPRPSSIIHHSHRHTTSSEARPCSISRELMRSQKRALNGGWWITTISRILEGDRSQPCYCQQSPSDPRRKVPNVRRHSFAQEATHSPRLTPDPRAPRILRQWQHRFTDPTLASLCIDDHSPQELHIPKETAWTSSPRKYGWPRDQSY